MRVNLKTMVPALAVMATLFTAPAALAEAKIGVLDFGRLMDESAR